VGRVGSPPRAAHRGGERLDAILEEVHVEFREEIASMIQSWIDAVTADLPNIVTRLHTRPPLRELTLRRQLDDLES
jgi:hypothetical protein